MRKLGQREFKKISINKRESLMYGEDIALLQEFLIAYGFLADHDLQETFEHIVALEDTKKGFWQVDTDGTEIFVESGSGTTVVPEGEPIFKRRATGRGYYGTATGQAVRALTLDLNAKGESFKVNSKASIKLQNYIRLAAVRDQEAQEEKEKADRHAARDIDLEKFQKLLKKVSPALSENPLQETSLKPQGRTETQSSRSVIADTDMLAGAQDYLEIAAKSMDAIVPDGYLNESTKKAIEDLSVALGIRSAYNIQVGDTLTSGAERTAQDRLARKKLNLFVYAMARELSLEPNIYGNLEWKNMEDEVDALLNNAGALPTSLAGANLDYLELNILNPIIKISDVNTQGSLKKILLCPPSSLKDPMAYGSRSAMAPEETTSFPRYFSKNLDKIKPVFKFFQTNLKQDLAEKKKPINQNGLDFSKDLILLDKTIESMREAIRVAAPELAIYIEDPELVGEKYQVTIISTDGVFEGVYLFFAGPTLVGHSSPMLLRLWLDKKYFKTGRELPPTVNQLAAPPDAVPMPERNISNPFGDRIGIGYLMDLDKIASLGNEDLDRAKNMMNCGFDTSMAAKTFNPMLNYLNFSPVYHQPFPIEEVKMTDAELSQWRAKQPVDVGTDTGVFDAAWSGVTDSLMSLAVNSHVVEKGDVLLLTGPKDPAFPFGSIEGSDGKLKPSKLTEIMKSYEPPPGKTTTQIILDINTGDTLLLNDKQAKKNLAKWVKASKREKAKGNALVIGQSIFLPRPRSKTSFKDSWGSVADSFSLEGKLTKEQLQLIWEKEIVDKLLLKICPSALWGKIKECLLPSNCRELIKFLGLWRTRDLLEEFIVVDVFDDRNGLLEALNQWDALVEEKYNFKAVHFDGNGFLKSGEFNSADALGGAADISMSFQIRIEPKDKTTNGKHTKRIFSIGETSKGGTFKGAGFSIKKTPTNQLEFELFSPEGKKASFLTANAPSAADIADNLWHQVGFSWHGGTGKMTVYMDGRKVETKQTSTSSFVSPIATSEHARVIIASENYKKSQKGFAGHIDEISLFERILSPEEWKSIAKINSDTNLATIGLSRTAKVWWRMGDCVEDDMSPEFATGKIIDKLGNIELTPVIDSAQKVIVARLFEEKDEDRFIDMINRETDIVRVCDELMKKLDTLVKADFDPQEIKKAILEKLKLPDFQHNPHLTKKFVIQDVLVTNLIRMMAQFLMTMLEKVLECQQWKTVLKGIVKGTMAGGLANLDVYAGTLKDNPISNFIDAVNDPESWEKLLKEDFAEVTGAYEKLLDNFIEVREEGQSPNEYTTLGLGTVQFADQLETSSSLAVGAGFNGSTVSVENISGPNSQNTLINIVKKISEELAPDESLGLFSSSPTDEALSKATEILNTALPPSDAVFTESDVAQLTGQVGSFLGLQGAIDQLQYAGQLLNDLSPTPGNYCVTSQDLLERMGYPKTTAEKEQDKASIQDILDQMDNISEETEEEDKCAIVIPMSDAEKASLSRTIDDVFAPILSAYDNDLMLHRLGLTSNSTGEREVKKVDWKGDEITQKTTDPKTGKPKTQTITIEKTQINPEFESMVKNGFVPLKRDGKTIDGTRFGGIVKTNWDFFATPWFKDGGFLSELRPPYSVAPLLDENNDVTEPDVEIQDIGTSLGPYTDYTEEYARALFPKVSLTGKTGESLSANMKGFLLSDSESGTRYFSERGKASSFRGMKDIETVSRTTLFSSPSPNAGSNEPDISLSKISHKVAWGKSLQGEKVVDFIKVGADSFYFSDVVIPFALSDDLKKALENYGYEDTDAECDPDALSDDQAGAKNIPESERFIPQEYAFEKVVQKNYRTGIPSNLLKSDVYNSLYREVMTALLYKTADSPLLKPVPGLEDATGEPMLALNFLNLNVQPRLLGMKSFASQVADDYSLLSSCPEGLVEPPLYSSLKISLPRILARICIIELTVRAIIPFTQLFFSRKDPVIKAFIMQKLENDLDLFSPDPDSVKTKIVQQYNLLAERGTIDAPPIEVDDPDDHSYLTTGWKTAMNFFLEEEYDFVVNRLKEMVHGDCIPESPEAEDDIKKGMYKAIFDYAELGNKDIKIETYAILKETAAEPARKVKDFSVKDQFEEIETLGTSLSYIYNGKDVVLSKFEQSMEDFLSETGIDFDDLECDLLSIYPRQGTTTEVEDHYHEYIIDENGNGKTSKVLGHEHPIVKHAVVPLITPDGEVRHSHSLIPVATQTAIDENFVESVVQNHLKDKLIKTDSFKIMFDFCFNLNDIASFIMVYCLVSVDDQIMTRTFSSTKKAIIKMFGWLWTENQSEDECETKAAVGSGLSLEDMFPDIADAFINPEYLLMLLLAPLQTYKGWSKVADPHVFITTTIMDLLRIPVIPKNIKKNVPDLDGKMHCRDWPTWNGALSVTDAAFQGGDNVWGFDGPYDMKPGFGSGVPIPSFLMEWGVAAGVTWGPCLVGMLPFPPTPFGFIYYFAVSPLIWVLKDLPKLLELLNKSPESAAQFAALLASTGMHVGGAITCDDVGAGTEEESSATTEEETDEGCPPVRDFTETIIEAGKSSEC